MSSRRLRLGLTVLGFALFAMPSGAMAGNWEMDPKQATFTITGGPVLFTFGNGTTFSCSATKGSGEFTSQVTGKMTMLYQACSASGFNCTSPGQPAGTIAVNAHIENVYLSEGKTTPGFTLTGPGGSPAETMVTFTCFPFAQEAWTGSINAHIESGCNVEEEATLPIEFGSGSKHGEPRWPYVTGDSTKAKDALTATRFGVGQAVSIDATPTFHFASAASVTCV